MRIRLNENYFFWCCEWCDTENQVLWARIMEVSYCGACHRPLSQQDTNGIVTENTMAAGVC